MEIKIPASVKEMTLKHLPFLVALSDLNEQKRDILDLTPSEIQEMLALFTGLPKQQFGMYTIKSNYNLMIEILHAFGRREDMKIPYELTYEGNTYVFQSDFTKLPTRWHVDTSEANVDKNPVDIMSFCYVEKGMVYGQSKDHKNIENPRHIRNKVFEKHVNLELFLAVQGFFLESWSVLRILPEARKRNETIEKRRKQMATLGNGKSLSIM